MAHNCRGPGNRYPADKRRPSGKLRLLTECFPLAMLIEEVGGLATTGLCRILDVVPKDVHEKSAATSTLFLDFSQFLRRLHPTRRVLCAAKLSC